MKKNTIKENIEKIKNMSSKMPKTINEALNFNEVDDYDEEMTDDSLIVDDEIDNEKVVNKQEDMQKEDEMDVVAFVDDIRKKSLKGMAQLADNPDDERYLLLKKIWQLCDKKPEQQNPLNQHQPNNNVNQNF